MGQPCPAWKKGYYIRRLKNVSLAIGTEVGLRLQAGQMGLRPGTGVGHNSLGVMLPMAPYRAQPTSSQPRRLTITNPAQAA